MKPRWRTLVFILLLFGAGAGAYNLGVFFRPPPELSGTAFETPLPVGNAPLMHPTLGEMSLEDFQGDTVLLFFGYTRCPDVCPFTLARLAKVYRELDDPAEVKVVMVTIDPGHDTPEITQRYVESFHPDFIGLSGGNAQVAEVAKTFFIGSSQLPDGLYTHTDMVVVVDSKGFMRRVYGQDRVPHLSEDLPVLLAGRDW
ncbi:MAG: SCO family protein [Trueperaceae bacterium]|nr:MAG: SCO family protein [Trueperaceae bacterium]